MNSWHTPPPPFNPEYKPYAKEVSAEVVAELEAEGWYENTTLAERYEVNLYVERYKMKMLERENELSNS